MKRIVYAIICVTCLVITMGWIETILVGGAWLTAQDTAAPKAASSGAADQKAQATAVPTYADVTGIFSKYHCTVCHGGAAPRAGLSLDDYKSTMKGGKDGSVIVPGDPGKSEVVLHLKGIKEPRMPYTGPPWLSDAEVETIERWIAAGAKE